MKTLVLADPPDAGGLRAWLGDFFLRLCAASKRSQRRTLTWARAVLSAPSPESLSETSSRWEELDTLLANAVMSSARGSVKRELIAFQEERFG